MTTTQAVKPEDVIAEARARRGAAYLDKRLPGWRRKIRRSKLNLGRGMVDEHGCGCVLAQLAPDGEYGTMTDRLGLDGVGTTAVRLGFVLLEARATTYAALTRAWKRVLREGT